MIWERRASNHTIWTSLAKTQAARRACTSAAPRHFIILETALPKGIPYFVLAGPKANLSTSRRREPEMSIEGCFDALKAKLLVKRMRSRRELADLQGKNSALQV